MKGIGILLLFVVLAGCASDPALKGPPRVASRDTGESPACPTGYYRMCEEKQGDQFCSCIRPNYQPSNSGVNY
jgi:hypothetical protein